MRAPPTCNDPVGDGANRTRTFPSLGGGVIFNPSHATRTAPRLAPVRVVTPRESRAQNLNDVAIIGAALARNLVALPARTGAGVACAIRAIAARMFSQRFDSRPCVDGRAVRRDMPRD